MPRGLGRGAVRRMPKPAARNPHPVVAIATTEPFVEKEIVSCKESSIWLIGIVAPRKIRVTCGL